jgi:hypothetical protein
MNNTRGCADWQAALIFPVDYAAADGQVDPAKRVPGNLFGNDGGD